MQIKSTGCVSMESEKKFKGGGGGGAFFCVFQQQMTFDQSLRITTMFLSAIKLELVWMDDVRTAKGIVGEGRNRAVKTVSTADWTSFNIFFLFFQTEKKVDKFLTC